MSEKSEKKKQTGGNGKADAPIPEVVKEEASAYHVTDAPTGMLSAAGTETPGVEPPITIVELKTRVADAMHAEQSAAEQLAAAKKRLADAEHALCDHIVKSREGGAKHVEVEVDGQRYKPKLFEKTGMYRLDRINPAARVTI